MRPQEPTITIRYIGRREYWADKLYRSGLDFEKGQVRAVPAPLGKSFLRHGDMFERADEADVPAPAVIDDTAARLAQAKIEQEDRERKESDRMDLMAQVDRLDKAGLAQFAQINYRQSLSKTEPLAVMRNQVRGMIDQYGIVA